MTDPSTEPLTATRRDRCLVLTINRPGKANALDSAVHERFVAGLNDAQDDGGIDAVVVTAAGGRVFSGGVDLGNPRGLEAQALAEHRAAIMSAMMAAILDFEKPLVVAVNGLASGGGFMLALCADRILYADSAVAVLSELEVGIPPLMGSALVGEWAGHGFAAEMALTGRRMPAETLAARGLGTVVPAAALLGEAVAEAERLAARPALAYAMAKRWFNRRRKSLIDETREESERNRPRLVAADAIALTAPAKVAANPTDGDEVLFEVRGGIGIITLNRPRRHNAMTDTMRAAIGEALSTAESDPNVCAILLRGEGPSFCSGRDTSELGSRPEGQSHRAYLEWAQGVRLIQVACRKPILAAIKGHVMGGGAELALGADFRIAADTVRISLPEVRYGLTTDTGSSILLPGLGALSRAKWMSMSGASVSAATALSWGFVDWVVPADRLDARAEFIAGALAALPRGAVHAGKDLMQRTVWADKLQEALGRELEAQLTLYEDPDYLKLRAERAAKAHAATGNTKPNNGGA